MRIVTWNINSVRLRAPLLSQLVDALEPDVLCLQEFYNEPRRSKETGGVFQSEQRLGKDGGRHAFVSTSLTNAIAKHDGAVTNLKITNRQQEFFEVLVDVEVRDLRHLGTVIAGLRAASGVTQVERARG